MIPPEPRPLDIFRVCLDLDPDERRQIMALSFADEWDAEAVALSFANRAGPKFVLRDPDGAPVCVGGYDTVSPGVMESWMLCTPRTWREFAAEATAGCRAAMAAMFEHGGAHRLQTRCLADRKLAMRWYRRGLGLKQEAVMERYGRHGENVVLFAVTREAG